MGCIYAISCRGLCPGCSRYEPEQYCGHAKDMGYENEDDYRRNEYPEDNREPSHAYDWLYEILESENK